MSYATKHLRNILQSIEGAGYGHLIQIEAYHGIICLLPPHSVPEEMHNALIDWGVGYNEDYGMMYA